MLLRFDSTDMVFRHNQYNDYHGTAKFFTSQIFHDHFEFSTKQFGNFSEVRFEFIRNVKTSVVELTKNQNIGWSY